MRIRALLWVYGFVGEFNWGISSRFVRGQQQEGHEMQQD